MCYENPYDGASTSYFGKVEAKLRRSRGRVRAIRKLVPSGRFLDVGSSGGFMSQAAREAGFDVVGIEPDAHSVAYARAHYPGPRYLEGTMESVSPADVLGDGPAFDVAYASEVIEHAPDIAGFLGAIAGLVRPGGILYLTTPDLGHWRRGPVERWEAFCPPAHLHWFTVMSLGIALERAGLRIARRRPAFKPGIKLMARKPG